MEFFEVAMKYLTVVFYGIMTVVHLARMTLRYGYSVVWGKREWSSPACLSDPALGEHRFITVNGVKLHYVISGPDDKPLMLFLHGFPEFWFSWRHQIKEFQKDYRIVAIDQRGYGESSKPRGVDSYSIANLMSDVRQVIQGLGYTSCILVAHDWGGVVAWSFARFFPDMVDKLIVMNAPSQPSMTKLLKHHKGQQKNSWYIYFFQLPFLPELSMSSRNMHCFDSLFGEKTRKGSDPVPGMASSNEIDAYKYTFSKPGAWTPPINWYRAAFDVTKKEIQYDMNFQMPILLIWGINDTALHIDLVSQMETDCPNMDVNRIPNVGHFVQIEAPKEVNAIIKDWLNI